MPDSTVPLHIVVMGVSGCGKSTIGQAIAERLGLPFIEGDSLHSARNVALMASGSALTDADRAEWLAAIAQKLGQAAAAGRGLVVSCSALKRRYRELLRGGAPDLRFIHLHGSLAVLRQRMSQRRGHYMPASLLDSQLATLEPPGADEAALTINIDQSVDQITDAALHWLQAGPG